MRRLCDNGDGKVAHARGLCNRCYQRAMYQPKPPRLRGQLAWPGYAVSRYIWRGVSCNDLPAVWAEEDRRRARERQPA